MATVSVCFSRPHFVGQAATAVLSSVSRYETMTSSGASQTSNLTADHGEICRVSVSGGAVTVTSGISPDTAEGGLILLDGTTEYIGLSAGETIAIQDV